VQNSLGDRFEKLRPFLYLFILLWINVYICRESFYTESTGHFYSMHGEWMALAKLGEFTWWTPAWWPWWGNGAPLEYTYAPLVPVLTAAIAKAGHYSYALAFHQLTGLTYCLTPTFLYLASWKITGKAGYSFAAALGSSLLSPILLIAPDAGYRLSALGDARRLSLIFDWDDLPHVISLTLLPLLVWALWNALHLRRWRHWCAAALLMAVMMLANMFGVVLVVLVIVTVPLAVGLKPRTADFARAVAAGVAAYILVCPWLPPSLIATIHSNSILDGESAAAGPTAVALAVVALASWNVFSFARKRVSHWGMRWLLLFGSIVLLIPLLDFYARLHFLPQAGRYKVEADLAIIWLAVFALMPVIERFPRWVRVGLILVLGVMALNQTIAYRRYTRALIQQVVNAQSIEYRVSKWLEENMPGQRVMLGGSMAIWADVFGRIPQVGALPYTTAPSPRQNLATFIIYTGMNAGEQDGAISLLWLKALGAEAVAVPGPGSPDYWKPFANPRKFEGLVPLVWRERDTSIYKISNAPYSLAHVMRASDLIEHAPVNGLDVGEIRRFVAALENPAAVPAILRWEGNNRIVIQTRLGPADVVSAQITFFPGWRARVNGTEREVHADGLGQMVVKPGCSGECTIVLDYEGGAEFKACRVVSSVFILMIAILAGVKGGKRLGPRGGAKARLQAGLPATL
jgi:hypothetical protein